MCWSETQAEFFLDECLLLYPLLIEIESNYSLNNRQKSELEVVKAEHFALQEKNDESIEALLNVIKFTKEKELKTRAFFNLGRNNDYKKLLKYKTIKSIEKLFDKEMKELGYLQYQEGLFIELKKSVLFFVSFNLEFINSIASIDPIGAIILLNTFIF